MDDIARLRERIAQIRELTVQAGDDLDDMVDARKALDRAARREGCMQALGTVRSLYISTLHAEPLLQDEGYRRGIDAAFMAVRTLCEVKNDS